MTTQEETNTAISEYQTIATSGDLEINILESVARSDYPALIEVSDSLADKFGDSARLTPKTIQKYFNFPRTFPFIARLNEEIIGYIIGVPLEYFRKDLWASYDVNLGEGNTIYTYAFAFKKRFHKTGYAKVLKRIYYNWMRKRGIQYVTGHVVAGRTKRFNGTAELIQTFDNWHGTGLTFEYYRRRL